MIPLLLLATATFTAPEVRRIPAPDAGQGVVSGDGALFAIDNRAIARIDRETGKVVQRWEGDPAHFKHLNSCVIEGRKLVCAGSNFPELPMESRIETFDVGTLKHLDTRVLGAGYGSLTWALWHEGAWWLCYANYDGHGGQPGRDHRATMLVRYDRDFHEQARWSFPADVLDRFTPRSASGGVWGADGLLYVTGHDLPELYALRVPPGGGVLQLVATIAIPTDGQAIGWDEKDPRLLWGIERKTHELVASRVPAIP